MRWPGTLPLLCLIACGRVSFDLASDANALTPDACANGHEDADGIDDGCDLCPHVNDPAQANADGDGVGDACDPNPATPGETIAFFDPFSTARSEWAFSMPPTFANDQLVFDARPQSFYGYRIDVVPMTDLYMLSGRVGAGDPTGSRQLTITLYDSGNEIYYCQLLDNNAGGEYFALTYTYDAMTYTDITPAAFSTRLENGPVFLRVQNTPTSVSCATNWPATAMMLSGAQPTDIIPSEMYFRVDGVQIFYDYFIQIHTQ